MLPKFAPSPTGAIPLHIVEKSALEAWSAGQGDVTRRWITSMGFDASLGSMLSFPDLDGRISAVLVGWGDEAARSRGHFHIAQIVPNLPGGTYRIASGLKKKERDEAALGWLLGQYHFDRYRKGTAPKARLTVPDGVDSDQIEAIAAGEYFTRDLINTPASDMGPEELEAAFRNLATRFDAGVEIIKGENLLLRKFPMIHAVGRAAEKPPRLMDLRWGPIDGPKVTLVGKGVCFDTGGLDVKPASSMGLMKKDMGGAATVMGLAQMIMELRLPIRLRVLVPCVENAIAGNAFRPQDILISRKGLTVEINNTDAEGRLILADALAYADEEKPELLFCLATLTGAARTALGADLPAMFSDDVGLATAVSDAGNQVGDPVWRMPFWNGYESLIEPGIADLDNAPSGGMAGAITAALFLRRFVTNPMGFAHFDIYGWTPSAKPARPKGGVGQAARALLQVLIQRFGR